jgi:hypothetical protein
LMPRGQASVQLKTVLQRQTPSLSFRISSRMSPASSRASKIKRCALTIAAGPKSCPSFQKTGQEDAQAAQRMHWLCHQTVPAPQETAAVPDLAHGLR